MPKHSALDIAKHKGEVLNEIMTWKRQEIPRQMEEMSLAQVKAFARLSSPAIDFAAALTRTAGASLIAEVKRASPSKGLIAQDWDPPLIAETYARNGAAAISCLTDSRFFQGELAYLTAIKERLAEKKLAVPVLRKEFIYHEYQVYEARMAGADAILLIVSVLGDNELRRLHKLSNELGMGVLVEVHDEAELERALAADSQIIGVNNRNLKTLMTDLTTTERLAALLPKDRALVTESGLKTPADLARMARSGAKRFLIGESLMRQADVEAATRALLTPEAVNA